MSELIKDIENLSQEEALEAAGFVSEAISADSDRARPETALLKPITDKPYQNIAEIEQLARLLLITAALTPKYEVTVRKAVEGAGQRQFILGGAEIAGLGALALYALHILVTKGKESQEELIEVVTVGDQTTTTIRKTTKYGVSARLGSMLKSVLGLG
jgi:hypothetical protein